MARQVSVTIDLTDDECAALDAMDEAQRHSFYVAKLAARFADDIAAGFSDPAVQSLLSASDRTALGRAVPRG